MPRAIVLVLALATVHGCGDREDDATTPPVTDTGELTMALRDGAGDFVSYAVDLKSIRLVRANGDVAATIPSTLRVDLADLVDLTELFDVATVPAGTYTRVVLDLDFGNARIIAQNDFGGEVAMTPVDVNGNALTTLAVSIDLPTAEPVRIVAGMSAAVSLDFDLAASNVLDFTASRVTVAPIASAITEFAADRLHRVHGTLASVDTASGAVTLRVLPFHARQGDFGAITFDTNDQTLWEVNGAASSGTAGLTAFAALAPGTAVIADGSVTERTLTAAHVFAGTSVPGTGAAGAEGIVTARRGNSLTLSAVQLDLADGTHSFRTALTVLVDAGTVVRVLDPAPTTHDVAAISVGQRIVAFGALAATDTLDATAGRVRLESTQLVGRVLQVSPLLVDLAELGGFEPVAFDFGGTASAVDVDPNVYAIDTSAATLDPLLPNDVVRISGLVRPFGFAPPAFAARTVVDVAAAATGTEIRANWRSLGGTAAPFNEFGSIRIDVDLTQARRTLLRAGVEDVPSSASNSVVLLSADDVRGVYVVTTRGSAQLRVFRDFAALSSELASRLDAGARLIQIAAIGEFDAGSLELTTPRASFEFAP